MSAEVWRRLRTKYPDLLFIPEFASTADYASTAGYGEADMGNYGVPELVKALYPDAFRVIVIEDADASENFDRFVGALREKNSLMTFGQGSTNFNTQMLVRMQDWLKLEDSAAPGAVRSATGTGLVELLGSSDPATAFHAARKLAATPDPGAASRLLELAGSEDTPWPLKRASVIALGAIPFEPAVPLLMELVADRTAGLYGDAAKALVAQDPAVESLVVDKISDLAAGSGMQRGINRFGSILILRKASARAGDLEKIYSNINEKDTNTRRQLLEVIGLLRNPESQAFLLEILPDPQVGPAAAAGLIRIGTPDGKSAVQAAQKAAQQAGHKDLAGAYGRALQVK